MMTQLYHQRWATLVAVAGLFAVGCTDSPSSGAGMCRPENPEVAPALARVDSLAREAREREEIPGLAVGVVCRDSLVLRTAYGVHAVDDPRPVTPATLFRIASVTKTFTATAIAKLADEGLLDLSDPLEEHLPWFRIGRPPATGDAPVTIRHLLTHTAGMPRDSRLTDFGRLFQPTTEAAIEALPDQELEAPPGERYAYSNLGYALLGQVVANVSGSTYEDYLATEILRPLGMSETLVHPTPDVRTAWGHGPRRSGAPRRKAGYWDLRFATPAGGMASSVDELARFVAFNLAPYRGVEPGILSARALREMHRVQFAVGDAPGGSGLSWGVETPDGEHAIYHGGELPDQTAYVLIDLRRGIGVIVLANARDAPVESLARTSLELVRRGS